MSQQIIVKGQSVKRSIKIAETQSFQVKVLKGHFYRFVLEQRGSFFAATADILPQLDTPFVSRTDTIEIEFVAKRNGDALLTIKLLDHPANSATAEYILTYKQAASPVAYKQLQNKRIAEKEALVSWIKQKAVPLKTTKVSSPFEDLQHLHRILAGNRVLALGEATHGSKEIFEMKHRLIEYLVTQLGYRVFALEASYGRCLYINNYILSGKGDLDTATAIAEFPIWRTEEVKNLIQWMRKYNEQNPLQKVQFAGFDLQVIDASAYTLSQYYTKVAPLEKAQIDTLLKKIDQAELNNAIRTGDTTLPAITRAMTDLYAAFLQKEDEYISKSSRQEYDEMKWHHQILIQLLTADAYNENGVNGRRGGRDYYMAQNVLGLLRSFPADTKMILWAHNGHVAKDYLDAVSVNVPSMGNYLKSELKEAYYAVGFDIYQGSFQANDLELKNSPGLEDVCLPGLPEENLSAYFVEAGLEKAFLDLSQLPSDLVIKEWLTSRRIGIVDIGFAFSAKWPPSDYTAPTILKRAFDGIIFLKESSRATPAKRVNTYDRYKFY